MVLEMQNKCSVIASVPMINWSRGKDFTRWAVLTGCGKTKYIDLVRGSKHPSDVICCGSSPPDPNKISMVLRTDGMAMLVKESKNPEKPIIHTENNEVEETMTKTDITDTVVENTDIESEGTIQAPKKTTKKTTKKTAVPAPAPAKTSWPGNEELTILVKNQSMRSLSKQLGASVNSIKKHCKDQGIEVPAMRFNWSTKTEA